MPALKKIAKIGEKMTSSGFFPPEMARRMLRSPWDFTNCDATLASYLGEEDILASEQFEMWHFGLLLLQVVGFFLCKSDPLGPRDSDAISAAALHTKCAHTLAVRSS